MADFARGGRSGSEADGFHYQLGPPIMNSASLSAALAALCTAVWLLVHLVVVTKDSDSLASDSLSVQYPDSLTRPIEAAQSAYAQSRLNVGWSRYPGAGSVNPGTETEWLTAFGSDHQDHGRLSKQRARALARPSTATGSSYHWAVGAKQTRAMATCTIPPMSSHISSTAYTRPCNGGGGVVSPRMTAGPRYVSMRHTQNARARACARARAHKDRECAGPKESSVMLYNTRSCLHLNTTMQTTV